MPKRIRVTESSVLDAETEAAAREMCAALGSRYTWSGARVVAKEVLDGTDQGSISFAERMGIDVRALANFILARD